jgi:ribonuclease G
MVLMPNVDYVGVSRRISEEAERERLKQLAHRVKPAGMGVIVRTVAEGAREEELVRDLEYLARLWERLSEKAKDAPAPSPLYQDQGLVHRLVRDVFDENVDLCWIDDREAYSQAQELLRAYAPHLLERCKLYLQQDQSLFDRYGVEMEIDKALRKRVWLKSGGYLVIDQTEALTSIDVNTGKFVGTTDLADTVFRANLEAAAEIARQLRLRDIGGIIIIDFIDMESVEQQEQVKAVLEAELKRDRTKANVVGFTKLGLLEMTRKKSRQNLDEAMLRPCDRCEGRGKLQSEETMAGKVRAEIRRIMKQSSSEALLLEVNPSVAAAVIGPGGAKLKALEQELGKVLYIRGALEVHPEQWNLKALGSRAEVEERALPVKVGQVLELRVEEQHANNPVDGIARMEGYVLDIEGAGKLIGKRVQIEVTRVYRTYAKAKIKA